MIALFQRFPGLAGRIPWLPLGRYPTPVERLDAAPFADLGAELWVKRDDLTHDVYGGNKVRKLEFLLAEARRRGARRLITFGAAGSHHALATAVHGRAQGFEVSVVLFPQPLTEHVRSIVFQLHAVGAEIRYAPHMETVPAAILAEWVARRGERPYVIPAGGSNPIGTLGYVSAGLELADQIAAGQLPAPRSVHVAGGTLGTAAGIALGFAMAGLEIPVYAARITGKLVCNENVLARLVTGAARILRRAGVPVPSPGRALGLVTLLHDQIGAGYGHETEAGREAVERFGRAGLQLDATYTAKAAAALIASLRATKGDGPRLFWHTLSAVEPVQVDPDADPGDLPEAARRLLEG